MKSERLHIIACGVLRLDMTDVIERLGFDCDTTWLEGGLHDDPARLRRELQSAIDAADDGPAKRIVVGYGLCGRGTVGIAARSKPLVIPRVHDCIALFLGADAAYRREFAKCPGTYYISAGWYDEKVQPKGAAKHVEDPRSGRLEKAEVEHLAGKYGEENAKEIVRFLSSWKRNYRRAAFIDTGAGSTDRYESYASAMADAFGWEYERIEGNQSLLEKAARGDASDGDMLIVQPGFVTEFDAKERKLVALPPGMPRSPAPVPPIHTDPAAPSRGEQTRRSHSIGIGIDAGGTYTDAVIFDFAERVVLDKGKALTTKWDYAEGIAEAIGGLDRRWFSRVDLVSVSTTLATNAIVEGTGQKTGLILMPHGSIDLKQFHEPAAVVPGRIDISGNEIEPVDTMRIASVAREMVRQGVSAFAVSGYGGSVNPVHEIAAKQAIITATGCDVCCGHELSDMLDFGVRANTAVLNAGIIPLLERFLEDVERVLLKLGIDAPVMVVKGDGTLMHASFAKQHPVETILSGPAASMAGARYLTDIADATVVDVGGTTSDIGKIIASEVRIERAGAEVGRWRTHVRAIDMRTVGLGGDSEVAVEKQVLTVGPRRIAPVCWLGSRWTASAREDELTYLEERLDDFAANTRYAQLFWATGRTPSFEPNDHERRVLEALEAGPLSVLHLVERSGCGHVTLMRTARLEAEHVVQRCGLTPTDIHHVSGELSLWDTGIAERYVGMIARLTGEPPEALCRRVLTLVTEKLVFELVRRQLDVGKANDNLEGSPTAKGILDVLLAGGNRHLGVDLELTEPVIGLGAAAPLFLTPVAKHLHAKLRIPDFAEVANAVGAVTSLVAVARTGSVVPAADGTYHLSGVAGAESYGEFETAYRRIVEELEHAVLIDAKAAGTDEQTVNFEVLDRMSTTADGAELFLERRVTARVTGVPR